MKERFSLQKHRFESAQARPLLVSQGILYFQFSHFGNFRGAQRPVSDAEPFADLRESTFKMGRPSVRNMADCFTLSGTEVIRHMIIHLCWRIPLRMSQVLTRTISEKSAAALYSTLNDEERK